MLDFGGSEGGSHGAGGSGGLPAGLPGGMSNLGQMANGASGGSHTPPPQPREVGTIGEELVQRPFQDLVAELKAWLGPKPVTSEADAQRWEQAHSRFEQLDQQQLQAFHARMQREHQRKQALEQEEAAAAQRKQAEAASSIETPSSPQKGPVGPGGSGQKSRSKMMTNVVNQNRQSFNKVQSSG